MTKKNLMPIIVLTAIALVVAALLGVVNYFTADTIKNRNEDAITASLKEVMDGEFNSEPDELREDAPKTISKVFTEKNGKGTVFVLVTNKGYTGKNIGFTLGIDAEGKITGLKVTENNESIVPAELKPDGNYGDNYKDAGADDIADLETGATVVYTESAIKNAIKDAFSYLEASGGEDEDSDLPREKSEIDTLAKELYGNSSISLKCTDISDGTYVRFTYKASGSDAYVAYAFNISQYGTPEFEILVKVNEDGKIEKIQKLLWKVSDPKPEYGYNPPAEDVVDAFFAGFTGKDSSNVESVDVATGVTSTSNRVKDAALEVLSLARPQPPRDKAEIESLAKALFGKSDITLIRTSADDTDFVRYIYRETANGEFVAYAFNISQYGTPEFEILIKVDANGKIEKVQKILWKVSDPMPEWGYNPPADDVVDAFFAGFTGKDSSNVESVDVATGVTATSGRVKDAVLEATKFVKPQVPRDKAEIDSLVNEFYGDAASNLVCFEKDNCSYVRYIYRIKESSEYIVYAFNISQYGTPEFEILVKVDANGKIEKVQKILWKVSDPKPEWGYNPPADDVVDAFFAGFTGKDSSNVESVDVATGVTSTSGRVKDAALEALSFFLPRDKEEIDSYVEILYGDSTVTFESSMTEDSTYVKLIYTIDESNEFIAYAFNISQYGTPEFEILVHVDENGNIKAVKKLLWKVSDPMPEYGYNPPSAEMVDAFFAGFAGKDSSNVSSVDVATGVTSTSNRVKDAALEALSFYTRPEIPRSETEIDSLAKELYGKDEAKLNRIEEKTTSYVRFIYRESGSREYIAYAFAISQYGTPEFEILVHVGADGKIKTVKKVLWKVSDPKPEWGYNPPAEDVVDAFFAGFTGKDSSNVASVDVATGVTSTSGRVKDAVLEALGYVLPREKEEIDNLASELYGNDTVTLECSEILDKTYVRYIYQAKGSKEYVAYAFGISQYGTTEFEFLVHVGADGKIKAIQKLLWKVSDPKPEWGYNPPEEDVVDAFFDGLVDKNDATVDSADVATGATSTSSRVKDAAKEVLEFYDDSFSIDIPLLIFTVLVVAAATAAIVYTKKRRTAK